MFADAAFVAFIPVQDVAGARDFYVGTLGLTLKEESPFAVVVDASGVTLRLTPVPDFRPQPFTIAGWEVASIQQSVDALVALGLTFNRYDGLDQDERGIWRAPDGDLIAWFSDPDGNTLSLASLAMR
jgi:catechol 2,3-dioxygenase-like lactoylglutathione lyase family enzyme